MFGVVVVAAAAVGIGMIVRCWQFWRRSEVGGPAAGVGGRPRAPSSTFVLSTR